LSDKNGRAVVTVYPVLEVGQRAEANAKLDPKPFRLSPNRLCWPWCAKFQRSIQSGIKLSARSQMVSHI